MNKKYELTNETIEVDGKVLHRIKALRDFYDVREGDLGGFIEKEENLSHEGNCWVYGDARVFGDAQVFGNSRIMEDARVFGYAQVSEDAWVFGNTIVCGHAKVGGSTILDM